MPGINDFQLPSLGSVGFLPLPVKQGAAVEMVLIELDAMPDGHQIGGFQRLVDLRSIQGLGPSPRFGNGLH